MTDLIPRDAAIAAVNLAIWKSPIKAQISTIDASNDTAEALQTLPTIDPAVIREAALKEAADIASGHDYSLQSSTAADVRAQNISAAILALIGEKK